jgi:hypothetical protein
MALVHITAARDALANLIDDLVNTGAGSEGTIEFQTGASAEVATILLSAVAFGASSGGTMTLAATTDDTNATGSASAVTKFIVKDQDGNEVFQGTVTLTSGGGDIELSATTIGAGSTVSITSFTYSASA